MAQGPSILKDLLRILLAGEFSQGQGRVWSKLGAAHPPMPALPQLCGLSGMKGRMTQERTRASRDFHGARQAR